MFILIRSPHVPKVFFQTPHVYPIFSPSPQGFVGVIGVTIPPKRRAGPGTFQSMLGEVPWCTEMSKSLRS